MKSKVIFICIIATVIVVLGERVFHYFYENKTLHEELLGKETAYKELNKNAAVLATKYQEQAILNEKLQKEWAKEKDALNGRIKILADAYYTIKEKEKTSNTSDVVTSEYKLNELAFTDGPPVGYVTIFNDGKVQSKIYDHAFIVKLAITEDDDSGKYEVATKAFYQIQEPAKVNNAWLNKEFPLNITGGTAIIDPIETILIETNKFYFLAPHINGTIGVYIDDIAPSVGLSLMGYGRNKRDLDWKFINAGLGYSGNKGFFLAISPALYRPFPNILQNTYLGAGASTSFKGTWSPFVSINLGF